MGNCESAKLVTTHCFVLAITRCQQAGLQVFSMFGTAVEI